MTLRVAIYARVSTSGQETDNQVRELEAYAARRGWQVTHRFIETEPGWEPDREKLKQLYSFAYRHEFDVVLVWALDRFSRQGARVVLELLGRLRDYGVQFVSYREEFLSSGDSHTAELVLPIIAWVAKQEHVRISERTRAGMKRAKAVGHLAGRPRKFAFDPDTARLLRSKGYSWRGILDRLGLPAEALSSVRRVCQKGSRPGSPGAGASMPDVPKRPVVHTNGER